ncbi:deoxypodophyllotoxin synthase-like [Wolffia australiana]
MLKLSMASEMNLSVPIVSISREVISQPEGSSWAEARAEVWKSIQEFGCVEIIYDGLTPEIKNAALNAAEELVSLPPETKRQNVAPFSYLGYIGQIPGFPYESLAIDNVQNSAAAQRFSSLMWPEGNPSFCDAVNNFTEAAAALEAALRRMVLESLGVEKYHDIHVGFTKYMMRVAEYAPPAAIGKPMRWPILPAHSDADLTTLSIQNDVTGFELKSRSGNWVSVKPSSPNSLVFLIGDSFRAWSNGRLYAPPHRVSVCSGEKRMAIMFFAIPKEETVIEAPVELVDGEKNQALFKPFRFLEYVEQFQPLLYAAGDDPASVLTTFCGTGAAKSTP